MNCGKNGLCMLFIHFKVLQDALQTHAKIEGASEAECSETDKPETFSETEVVNDRLQCTVYSVKTHWICVTNAETSHKIER